VRLPSDQHRWPRVVLATGGMLALLVGVSGIVVGWRAAGWLYSLLPVLQIDAAAVGGAAVSLGLAIVIVGIVQLVAAVRLGRRSEWERTATVTLTALVGATLASFGVSAFTAAATANQPWLVAAGLVLLGGAVAYGISAWLLARPSV
jgi:hypothetical protein